MGMGNIANSGMQAAMSDMEVISNNVANANTPGFKSSSANFSDMFPSSVGTNSGNIQTGLGVELNNIVQNFSPGGSILTNSPSDLYIPGNGFFIVKDSASGQTSYTRLGNFDFNTTTGYFSKGNQRLQGFPAVNGVISTGNSTSDLYVNTSAQPAKASATVSAVGLNLNSGSAIPATSTFNMNDSSSYNTVSPSTVFDSLGNQHTLNLYYVKTAANNWSVYASIDGTLLNGSSPGLLAFNSSGTLSTASGLDSLSYSPSTGAADMTLSLNMSAATQYGSADTFSPFVTDGYAAGVYGGYSIDSDGIVTASYTNGTTRVMGQVAVARFQNDAGLQYDGSSTWSATTLSGEAIINQANSIKNITNNAVEMSNVDLATELVNLTEAQNAFQANAQVEQVYNHIMDTVTKL